MANINKAIRNVKKALQAKGVCPLINTTQFYGDDNKPITKYIIHYGNPDIRSKNNDVIDTCYSKIDMLNILLKILNGGA